MFSSSCALVQPTDPYKDLSKMHSSSYNDSSADEKIEYENKSLTIDEAIDIGLKNNPELMAIAHEAEESRYRKHIARSQVWPNLHLKSKYEHSLDEKRVIPSSGDGEPAEYSRYILSGDLVLSMPLFTGGRIISEIKAAKLLEKAAEHRLAQNQDELIFNICSVFYGILQEREVIESLEYSKKAIEEHLVRIKDLIDMQKAAKVDQLRTEVRLSDLKQQLVTRRNMLEIQNHLLAKLLGLEYSDNILDPVGELKPLDTTISDVSEAFEIAIKNRPDYLAAQSKLEAQAKSVDAVRAKLWPTLYIQESYGVRRALELSETVEGSSDFEDIGTAGIMLDIPIFERGETRAKIGIETQKLLAAKKRFRKLQLEIKFQVETALLDIVAAKERVKVTESAVEQAKESLRIESEKYDLGKGVVVDVLDAQAALMQAETNYSKALTDLVIAQAKLKLSIGEIAK
ncbi:MAG: TolC family protein [Candidatus Zixiibacteriota bacterium]